MMTNLENLSKKQLIELVKVYRIVYSTMLYDIYTEKEIKKIIEYLEATLISKMEAM